MLAKEFRLTGKDINFLVKKRQYVSAGYFSFFYFKQYPNLSSHQLSVNIPLKFSKRAVFRHTIKRAVVDYARINGLMQEPIKGASYKIFVMLNKSSLVELQKAIEKLDKKDIILYIQSEFEKSWKVFQKKIR